MPAALNLDEFNAFLDSKPGWIVLTSIGPDGYPHSVPLGYFRHGERILCGVRDGTRKIRNIESNPKVSLLVESGSSAWRRSTAAWPTLISRRKRARALPTLR